MNFKIEVILRNKILKPFQIYLKDNKNIFKKKTVLKGRKYKLNRRIIRATKIIKNHCKQVETSTTLSISIPKWYFKIDDIELIQGRPKWTKTQEINPFTSQSDIH